MPDAAAWTGRRVLVTGDTGFKGSWLSLWLARLGAEVTGFSAGPPSIPSLYEQARVGEVIDHVDGDVCDRAAVVDAVSRAEPEVVFHLAAQPIVRRGVAEPVHTIATNVLGTAHVLDACRDALVVCVTSDKCYAPGHAVCREGDPLGGRDPYSASKAAQEHVCTAFRETYGMRIATVRAGNVIGGGDWAQDRLIPDAVRAACSGRPLEVRFPDAVRPWQHVLEPLAGYLLLAEHLEEDPGLADAWNFGPAESDAWAVRDVVDELRRQWDGCLRVRWRDEAPHEEPTLRLDAQRARDVLDWAPRWDVSAALAATVSWYEAHRRGADARDLVHDQIEEHQRV